MRTLNSDGSAVAKLAQRSGILRPLILWLIYTGQPKPPISPSALLVGSVWGFQRDLFLSLFLVVLSEIGEQLLRVMKDKVETLFNSTASSFSMEPNHVCGDVRNGLYRLSSKD